MWPIYLWAVTQSGGVSTVSWVNHWSATVTAYKHVDYARLLSCFVRDDSLATALAAGAAVIVITAQMDRVCGKYGNRGWSYVLIEAGQVLAHLEQNASSLGLSTRALGGFYEARVQEVVLPEDLAPLLCVLVADEQGA